MDEPAVNLARQVCVACRADSPRVEAEEAAGLLDGLPGWTIASVAGIDRLTRRFAFVDFAAALEFVNLVGELADAADHHPEITIEWGAATVSWWTHTIGGLHRNDFIMAARTTQVGR